MKTITIEYTTKKGAWRVRQILAVNLISFSKLLMSKGCYKLNII